MASLTAAILIKILNLAAAFDDETLELIIDTAINMINLYGGLTVPNMTGTAGLKTISLTSEEWGAVVMVAKVAYQSFYENQEGSMNVGGIAIASSDLMANPTVMNAVKKAARQLYKTQNELDVSVG